jgi:RNA polymerase sigma-70 factor (ECF subfamily)
MPETSDQQLIENTRNGDDDAFCELVRRYQARLRGFAARYVSDPHDVDDLVQDAFVNAYNNLDRFDLNHEFWPWLRTICKNRTFNFLRSRKTRRHINLQLIDEALETHLSEDETDDGTVAERIEALRQCIGKLKDSQRELITLRYHSRQHVKDIASTMQQSAAGLAMRLYRIRAVLKKCVQQQLQTNNP